MASPDESTPSDAPSQSLPQNSLLPSPEGSSMASPDESASGGAPSQSLPQSSRTPLPSSGGAPSQPLPQSSPTPLLSPGGESTSGGARSQSLTQSSSLPSAGDSVSGTPSETFTLSATSSGEYMSGSPSQPFPGDSSAPSSEDSMPPTVDSSLPSSDDSLPHPPMQDIPLDSLLSFSSDESLPGSPSQTSQKTPVPALDKKISEALFRAFIELSPLPPAGDCIPIMVNACTGKMGMVVIEEAETAGLFVVPVSFGSEKMSGQICEVCGKDFFVQGPSNRESVLKHLLDKYPDLIVVDYTVSTAVNDNVELYCKVGVPFVLGTCGGDRNRLFKTIQDSQVYALASLQMAKQAVAFIGILEAMAIRFPGLFSGYSLQVMESIDVSRVYTSGTTRAAISCFNRLGVPFNINQIESIRKPELQLEMVGIDEEHLFCHEFYMFNLTSPDKKAQFEFQISIGGRSIYAQGTLDAVNFLARKVQERDEKRMYNMLDVLREGYKE